MRLTPPSLILAAALALFIGAWAAAEARAEVSVSASPSLVELESAPGGTGEQNVTIRNTGREPFSGSVYVKEYPGADKDLSATGWLSVSPERVTVRPGESRDVTVGMQVPQGTPSGGRYALVALRTDASDTSSSGTATSGEIAVPLLFTVKGQEPLGREAEVARVIPRLLDDGTIGFQILVRNDGNRHFFPRGDLAVKDESGETLETLTIPEAAAVIPGTERPIDVSGSLSLERAREYTAEATVEYGRGKRATAEHAFSPNDRLAIEDLGAQEQSGGSPKLGFVLSNRGELAIRPQVRLDIFNDSGLVGTAAPDRSPDVWPDEKEEISAAYPGLLGPGKYVLQATVTYADGRTIDGQATFTINEAVESAQAGAPRAPSGGRNWLVIGGIALGALLLAAAAVRWLPPFEPMRRRLGRAWKAFSQPE